MSALDVLAARRRVIESSLELQRAQVERDQASLLKAEAALESIREAEEVLSQSGFEREWDDAELGRMRFDQKPLPEGL